MYHFFSHDEDLTAVMSTQIDGDMSLQSTADHVARNRQNFCAKNFIDIDHVVNAGLTHSTHVAVVEHADQKIIEDTDALVTRAKNVFLSLTTADCFPVLFYEREQKIVGIAHAGWRGVVGEIVPRTINVMTHEGAHPRKIRVAVGPGISAHFCDFDFADVIAYFGFYNQDKYIASGSTMEKVKVDLRKIIIDQLRHYNIADENIHNCAQCTYANQHTFFSARRDGKGFCRMMSLIGMPTK